MKIGTFGLQEKERLFWCNGDNSKEVEDYMRSHEITRIVFSLNEFQDNTVTLHKPFDFVEEVDILDTNITNLSFIYEFPNLKRLNIQNADKTKIDFDHFWRLEEVFLTWRKGITNLLDKKSLKTLTLNRFKEKALIVGDDMLLEEIRIINSPIENLSSLSKLTNLVKVELAYLRLLEDSSWLKSMKNLEELIIISCKKMSPTILYNISELPYLRKLFFENTGVIPTLKPIENMRSLEEISFIVNTKIEDGDMRPLSKLPNLKKLNRGLEILLQQQMK